MFQFISSKNHINVFQSQNSLKRLASDLWKQTESEKFVYEILQKIPHVCNFSLRVETRRKSKKKTREEKRVENTSENCNFCKIQKIDVIFFRVTKKQSSFY